MGNPSRPLYTWTDRSYRGDMGETYRFDLDNPSPLPEGEDEETLAAIDEGVRDADAERTVSIEAVRKLVPQRIKASASRRER